LAGVCRAILALLFALTPWFASARAEESLSGFPIEGYWTEVHQRVDRSFPSTQNNQLSLFVVDPRTYTVENVRNWDKPAESRHAIEGGGAFGALEANSSGEPKLRVTRDGSRFTITNYAKNHKRVVILDVHEKSCAAEISYQLDAGENDYLFFVKRRGAPKEWRHLSSIAIRNVSCRVRDMTMG
jgi:hypothetical protein